MKQDEFVTIDKKSEDNSKTYTNDFRSRNDRIEKILFIISLAIVITAIIVTGAQFGKLKPASNSEDGTIAIPTEEVITTEEPTQTPYPTPVGYAINTKVENIDDLFTDGVLTGTDYESRKFYCSKITPYLVKTKTGCEVFLFWDNLDILIVNNDKLIVIDQYNDYDDNYYTKEEIPEIQPCDFNGDGVYELLLSIRTCYEYTENDKLINSWGTAIVHLDLKTMIYEEITKVNHDFESHVFLKSTSSHNFEVYKYISNYYTTDDIYYGEVVYDNGHICYNPIQEFIPNPTHHSEDNINSISWTLDLVYDLNNNGIEENYTLVRSANLMILKDSEGKELISFDVGWLFKNTAGILDLDAIDMNNDGEKEICFISIDEIGRNQYLAIAIAIGKVNGEYRRFFRSTYLGELELKKLEDGYYDLYWCVNKKNLLLNFDDKSFYTPSEGKNLIIKPKSNVPRSLRFDTVDGKPVVVVEWSMYIDGYSGRLETLVTNYLTIGKNSFNESFEFEIEAYLGKPASNSDFIVNK